MEFTLHGFYHKHYACYFCRCVFEVPDASEPEDAHGFILAGAIFVLGALDLASDLAVSPRKVLKQKQSVRSA